MSVSQVSDLAPYAPILIFMGIAFGFSLLLVFLAFLRGPRRPSNQKLSPYECGFEALDLPTQNRYESTARMKFDIRFYLVAILFIIFDLEVALLFPWAIQLKGLGWFGFLSVMIFLGILTVGFIYEWKKGALEWE